MTTRGINHTLWTSAIAAGALFSSASATAMDIMARVISSTPVVYQVAVPRQVCNHQQVLAPAQRSGGGALLGAVAGGAAGNAIGNGGGRALATMLGVFGGAVLGDRIEGPGGQQVQNVQQCSVQTFYENRPSHYNVVYEYQGTRYNTQMAADPGQFVRLQVTPVGAINSAPQPVFNSPPQPHTYYQTPTGQPLQIQQPMGYGQAFYGNQGVYQSFEPYPQHYGRGGHPFYAPTVSPIGLSLNFGVSRGGHHWR